MSYIADAFLKAIAKIATPLEEKVARLEAELAESRRVNASLNKEHRDLAEKLSEAHNVAQALEDSAQEVRVKLAEAKAKIEAVRVIHSLDGVVIRRSDGQRYCGTDWETHPCGTIRALESTDKLPRAPDQQKVYDKYTQSQAMPDLIIGRHDE